MIWLLDTNMPVYARNGVALVVSRLDEVWEHGDVVTSLLVVGELIYGVEKSIRREANLAAVEQQLAMLDAILPLTDAIVRRFGRLKAELGRRGDHQAGHRPPHCGYGDRNWRHAGHKRQRVTRRHDSGSHRRELESLTGFQF